MWSIGQDVDAFALFILLTLGSIWLYFIICIYQFFKSLAKP